VRIVLLVLYTALRASTFKMNFYVLWRKTHKIEYQTPIHTSSVSLRIVLMSLIIGDNEKGFNKLI